MKYFKFEDEYVEIESATTYFETTDDGVYWRQISYNGAEYIASNVVLPSDHMGLPEGKLEYDEGDQYDDLVPIRQSEFEAVWNQYLATRVAEWHRVKATYPIGTVAKGTIQLFYPHGILINLGSGVLGIANSGECDAAVEKPFSWRTGLDFAGIVAGYDETHQWVVLGSPQITPHDKHSPRRMQ